MNINKKVVVVTGAASGMGAATAEYFANKGAKVALLDKQLAKVKAHADAIKGLALECDVTDAKSAEQAFEQLDEQLGVPSVCVNCAGICPGKLIVSKDGRPMSLDDYLPAIQVNLIGTFNIMRLAAAAMSQAKPQGEDGEQGVIINTASVAAFEGQIGQIAYSASKGGVSAMTLPAARELAKYGIRVVAIAPGLVDTAMLQNLPDKVREHILKDIPFPPRFGKPQEYADLVGHIVANSLINGTVMRLDGGLRMAAK